MKIRCGLFTNIAPAYSRPLWNELTASDNVSYYFCSSSVGFAGIQTIDPDESKHVNTNGKFDWSFVRNIYFKEILLYQKGMVLKCLRSDYDAYIFNGEMYCISTWISSLILAFRRKPVLFWGHGIYGNEKYIKKFLRILFYKLADSHLVYGNRAKDLMVRSGFSELKVFCVYNSLDYRMHKELYRNTGSDELELLRKRVFPQNSKLPVIIFIGRLTRQKKISLLLEAIRMCREKGNDYNCLIVGTGPELKNLIHLSLSFGITDLMNFYGSSYDETTNLKLLMLADCCVSPGNVGLTAIHSLSAGTPVITHHNYYNQNPEVEAVVHDKTGLLFEENNVTSLSATIDNMILSSRKLEMKSNCIEQIDKLWNPINQASVFDEAVMKSVMKDGNRAI
jgi:glycosyltransferase involved in cell wall biosynthesis